MKKSLKKTIKKAKKIYFKDREGFTWAMSEDKLAKYITMEIEYDTFVALGNLFLPKKLKEKGFINKPTKEIGSGFIIRNLINRWKNGY